MLLCTVFLAAVPSASALEETISPGTGIGHYSPYGEYLEYVRSLFEPLDEFGAKRQDRCSDDWRTTDTPEKLAA